MHSTQYPEFAPGQGLSRRGLIRGSLALGALALLSACGTTGPATATTASTVTATVTAAPVTASPVTVATTTAVASSSATTSAVSSATAASAAATTTSAAASQARPSGAQVTIHMLERAGQEAQALDIRIPQFMQQNPNIKVLRDSTPGDIIQKEATLAAADTLPDTVHSYLGDESYQFFAANGILIPIEDRLARDKVDLAGWFPSLIDVMRVDGKLHGLPFKGQVLTSAFFFNTDLFDQAGVTYPTENWTLDDLTSMAEKLTKRQGSTTAVWGYGLQTWGGENWTGHVRNWDAEWLSADGKTSQINTKPIQTALQWYYDMASKAQTLAPSALDAANKLFPQGQCAILGRAYCNYKSNTLSPGMVHFKWNMTLPPKGTNDNRGGMFAGDSQAITKDSKQPDAAFELLKWLTDQETGVQLGLQTKGSSTLGGRPDVYADPRIVNEAIFPKEAQQAQLQSVQVLKGPYSAAYNYRASDIYAARDKATQPVQDGKTQPDTGFLAGLNQQVQAILDQPRPTKI